MWALVNRTPYAAERTWIRDAEGRHHWMVAVKATFNFDEQGKISLAGEQESPLRAAEYFGEPGLSSLRADGELSSLKKRTDVLLAAEAYAPSGRAASKVEVGLRVGPIDKKLLVFGERVYRRGLLGVETSAPEPFVRQKIQYELAFGGTDNSDPDPQNHRADQRNPVGRGFVVRNSQLIDQPAHRIEYLQRKPSEAGPAGFGPIDVHWSPRLELGGTYDEAWQRERSPLLPADYDALAAQSAPADQQCAERLLGQPLELRNLTPRGLCKLKIPELAFEFETRLGLTRKKHPAHLATIFLEPTLGKLQLLLTSSLAVDPQDLDYLDTTVITETRNP